MPKNVVNPNGEWFDERISFPQGYQVLVKRCGKRNTRPRPLFATFSKNGFLFFNVTASKYIFGESGQNKGCLVAYNPLTKTLAVKPVPYLLKMPRTQKIIAMGGGKRTSAAISFRSASNIFNIPMIGKRFPCSWDEEHGMMVIPLMGL